MNYIPCLTAAVAALLVSTAASATCPANTVCASDPETVVAALTTAGYKAKLSKDKTGDPTIESAASGYEFSVFSTVVQRVKTVPPCSFRPGGRRMTSIQLRTLINGT